MIDPFRPRRFGITATDDAGAARLLAALALAVFAPAAHTATIIPPRDYAELASAADVVALVEARDSRAFWRGDLIFTTTAVEVVETIAGSVTAGDVLRVESPGGELDGRVWAVAGAPDLRAGERYLVCLRAREDDSAWLPMMLSWGILREELDPGGPALLVPDRELDRHAALPRVDGASTDQLVPVDRDLFLARLRAVLAGEGRWSLEGLARSPSPALAHALEQSVAGGADGAGAGAPAGCAYITSGGRRFRFRTFDTGGAATIFSDATGDLSIAGGAFSLVQEAMDLWMGVSGSGVNLRYGGPRPVALGCSAGTDAAANSIVFNDPCSDIADLDGCAGVLAFGGPNGSTTHAFDGETWVTIDTWIVVVNNGAGCVGAANYRILLAHELGHGLGFGHVDDAGALMFASCCRNPNDTDRICLRYTYPAPDPANARPRADAGGDRTLELLGDVAPLRGAVSDDGLPDGNALETRWTQLAGPGSVAFADATALETTARFSRSGSYLLGLEAYDGALLHIDTVTIDVSVRAADTIEVVFEQGHAGYAGTVDTFVYAGAPDAGNSAATSLDVDSDSPGGSGFAKQSLLRFDGIFDDGIAGRIPRGAMIRSAVVELSTTNPGDGAFVHRMAVPWSDDASWNGFGPRGVEAGTAALRERDDVADGSSDPTRFDVTASVRAWSGDPASNLGWALLPRGSNGWDFDSAEGPRPPRLVVELPVVERRELIAIGDVWQYHDGRSAPPGDWTLPEFAPETPWESGPTGIGFGDGDDATVVVDMFDDYLTLYCRREFDVDADFVPERLLLEIDYDDGFVAWLNGVEVARSLVLGEPGTPVDRLQAASTSHEAGIPEAFEIRRDTLPPGTLRAGRNVLAIEVHNAAVSSGDLSCIPRLSADLVLVAPNAEWRFERGSRPIPPAWAAVDFDDTSWERGRASIGYGGGDDLTELTDMRGAYASVFCRTVFEVACPERIDALLVSTVLDDGAVVWLNGSEVARINMPAGPVTATTLAAGPRAGRATLELPAALLRRGRNVLAASVHNASLDSADLTFAAIVIPTLAALDGAPSPCDAATATRFVRGEVVADGRINVSDAVALLLTLFQGEERVDCADAADTDDDGRLTISDAVAILRFLFGNGPGPAPPGLDCDTDPSIDNLAECARAEC